MHFEYSCHMFKNEKLLLQRSFKKKKKDAEIHIFWCVLNSSYRPISFWPLQLACYACDILGGSSIWNNTIFYIPLKNAGHRTSIIYHLMFSTMSKYILLPYRNYQKGLVFKTQFLSILRQSFSNIHNMPASQETK